MDTIDELEIIKNAKVDETTPIKQLEYGTKGFFNFGICCGYEREEHLYSDNRFHYKNSHGLCVDCNEKYLKNEVSKE